MEIEMINEDIKKIGGPYHRFFIFNKSINHIDAFKKACSNKSEALVIIPDDLIRYFNDFFCWIPTFFIQNKSIIRARGFDYEGWSMIDEDGKDTAVQILQSLKNIFECAPPEINLTGQFEENMRDYIKIYIKKESILYILNAFLDTIRKIKNGKYILHLGV